MKATSETTRASRQQVNRMMMINPASSLSSALTKSEMMRTAVSSRLTAPIVNRKPDEPGAAIKDLDLPRQPRPFSLGGLFHLLGQLARAVHRPPKTIGQRQQKQTHARNQNDRADGFLQHRYQLANPRQRHINPQAYTPARGRANAALRTFHGLNPLV